MFAYVVGGIANYVFSSLKSWFTYTPTIQYKKQAMPKKTRQSVWLLYNGTATDGKCFACGEVITSGNWHCSHVIAEAKGGTCDVNNLRPCCAVCNLKMGNQNLYAFVKSNKLKGKASRDATKYFATHPDQVNDLRSVRKSGTI